MVVVADGIGAGVGALCGEGAAVGASVEEGGGDVVGEAPPDVHTASITKESLLHFVPTGTGFTKAAPLAH